MSVKSDNLTQDSRRGSSIPVKRKLLSENKVPALQLTRLVFKNEEMALRHSLAQDIISLLGENERSLEATNRLVWDYLGKGDYIGIDESIRAIQRVKEGVGQRMRNIGTIFDLVDKRRTGSMPGELLEHVYKTPRSLSRALDFTEYSTK